MRRRFTLFALLLTGAFCASAAPAWGGWWKDAAHVQQGIARAVTTGWMTPDDAAKYRAILGRSTYAWQRLGGTRSSNLAGVLHDVAAQWQAYTAPRAVALFSMLDTNTRYLGSDPLPAAGSDVLDADGVVYRSFPGQGLQFHPLASFARLNSLLARGFDTEAWTLATALLDRAIPRKGALVWEYYFPFAGGGAPWTSGMVQAVAARALAADGYLAEARKAYLSLPGLTFGLSSGPWIRLYSFSNLAVLNAQLQSALSLSGYGALNQDAGASVLADRMLAAAAALFPRFDTGAWSLYALGGPESPLNYHVFVVGLLQRIAEQTKDPLWASRAARFDLYTTQPPTLSVRGPSVPVRKLARFSFWLSKISHVTLTVGGTVTSLTLTRGSHVLTWSAAGRSPGNYAATLSAVDLAGNKAVKTVPIRVAPSRKPPLP